MEDSASKVKDYEINLFLEIFVNYKYRQIKTKRKPCSISKILSLYGWIV